MNRKVALVTGAAGSLGSLIASRLIEKGWTVHATTMGAPPEDAAHLKWRQIDLAKGAAVTALANELTSTPIDAVVHCAGGFRWTKVEDLRDEDLNFLIDANFRSSVNLARAFGPILRKSSAGRFVFVGATAPLKNPMAAGMAPYAATKAALHALVAGLAEELRESSVTVNAILPSILDTPANRKDMPNADFTSWVSLEQAAQAIEGFLENPALRGVLLPLQGRVP